MAEPDKKRACEVFEVDIVNKKFWVIPGSEDYVEDNKNMKVEREHCGVCSMLRMWLEEAGYYD